MKQIATIKTNLTVLFTVVAAVSAFGGNFYLKSGATDWGEASSYCKDAGRTQTSTSLPGSADSVFVPAGSFTFDCSTVAGRASLSAASNTYELVTSEGTELVFDVSSGEVGLGCRIRHDKTTAGRIKSTLVKNGAGALSLLASADDEYLYAVNLDVRGGILRLAQGTTYNQNFGWLKMADGTTLWLPCSPSNATKSEFHYIKAEEGSTITNATTRAAGHNFGVRSATASYDTESYIKGAVGGGVRVWTVGSIRFEGTNNTFSTQCVVEGNSGKFYQDTAGNCVGVILAKKLGISGAPSSIGTAQTAILGYGSSGSGGFRYIGDGETCDKTFYVYQGVSSLHSKPVFFDAGPHGGVTFTGSFAPAQDGSNIYGVRRLWLTGENTSECIVSGDIGMLKNGDVTYPTFVTKSGTGIWRLAASRTRSHVGGFAVLDGTLKFDSIDERGFVSALGYSTVLTADDAMAVSNNQYVDYAFTLGGGNGDPVFEYSGSAGASCTTRPLVLAGSGGHLRASNGRLLFGGISARDVNATPTLTLDGTGDGNVVKNISDGATGARVSVVKDGSGSWTLSGDQTFTGDVIVRNGTLSILTPSNTNKWFRLSIAKIVNSGNLMLIRQICLFDKDGVRQNGGLTMSGTGETTSISAAAIGAGQAWYDSSVAGYKAEIYPADHGGIDQAFNGGFSGTSGRYSILWKKADGSACSPTPLNKSTWIPIVMHLPDSANPVTHFDIQAYENKNDHMPSRILLETSRDGEVWEIVYSNLEEATPSLSPSSVTWGWNKWITDGNTANAAGRPEGEGLSLDWHRSVSQFPAGINAKVFGGGLSSDADTVVKSLALDACGGWTIDGLVFAENGTLDILNWSDEVELPGLFRNCEGLDNLESWTLSFDGVANSRNRVSISGGKMRILKPGIMLIVW